MEIQENQTPSDGHIQYQVLIKYLRNNISPNRFVDNLCELLKSCRVSAFVKSRDAEIEGVLDGNRKHDISCLSELYEMMNIGKRVFPLYLDVEPLDSRWFKHSYVEAFKRHGGSKVFTLKHSTIGRSPCVLFRSNRKVKEIDYLLFKMGKMPRNKQIHRVIGFLLFKTGKIPGNKQIPIKF